eukprot:1864706-Heterocapsa_arctica.AAC.1
MNDSINGTLKEVNHRMEGIKGEVVQVKEDVSTLNKRVDALENKGSERMGAWGIESGTEGEARKAEPTKR